MDDSPVFELDRNCEHLWSPALVAILLAVALVPSGAAPVAAESFAAPTPSNQPAFSQDRVTEDSGVEATVDAGNRSARLRVLTANGSQPATLSSRTAVETAIENGTFDDDGKLSVRDTLLVELEMSGIAGPLENQSGPNSTAKFLNLLDRPGFSLTVRENGSTINTHDDGVEFSLTPGATNVVTDPANETYYVLLDLARLPRHEYGGSDENPDVENGDVYDVNFTVAPSSGVYETRQSFLSQVRIVGWATVDAPVTVVPDSNQTVEIRSNVGSSWGISVVLKDDDGWIRSARTVEAPDAGGLVATFDLSDRSPGDTLTLVVKRGDRVLYSEQDAVHVQSPTSTPSPTETLTSSPTPTPTVSPNPTERTPAGTPGTVPGFGPVATVVALAVVLMAVGRRRW